ncbi:uncharacterized protein LOC128206297 [Mya arenaria]|uniref:uncharacterized protein LOC128206297 n=1 Tax=Mya arenaria TaxID=6604 RepID=UPI0022E71F00|nr:uncharacterized protein LOC128206297 [Mya arenaria]XP_052764625.1 uncharacterized protein LOC128206297 [Mya arenaria]
MHILLTLVALVAVFGSLRVNGDNSDMKKKCFADLKTHNKCPKNIKARRLFFFNSTSCQCEQSSQCLNGPNSFKTEAKCESQCMGLVGNGEVSEECTDYSTCSVTCGQCTLTINRNCTPEPDNICSCSGNNLTETRPVELPPCGKVLAQLNAGDNSTDIYNIWVSQLGNWMDFIADTVSITLLKDGNVVQFITFNGTGSTSTNWFSAATLIATSWSTLDVDSSFYFGPGGTPFQVDLDANCSNPRKTYLRVIEDGNSSCTILLPDDKPVILYHPQSCKAPVDYTAATMEFADTMFFTYT